MRPVIALVTDFGTRDHYAGTIKGVILGICADATVVDITHDIPPHDVTAGALELAAA
jgi:S-adenosylmethionine hydrolase